MEIKTVRNRLDNANDFDVEVNQALAEGWILKKEIYLRSSDSDRL